jgi:hypothetical protein
MRAILCGCNRRLQANDYEGLVEEVLNHLLQVHYEIRLGEPQVRAVREIVASCSYFTPSRGVRCRSRGYLGSLARTALSIDLRRRPHAPA